MQKASKNFKKKVAFSFLAVVIFCLMGFVFCVSDLFAEEPAKAAESSGSDGKTAAAQVSEVQVNADVEKFKLIAAAVTFGFGAIAAGIAVGNVGSAAMGAIGEKPEIAGQALLFVALGEGIMLFGFVLAFLILG